MTLEYETETSVTNYESTQRKVSEERRLKYFHLQRFSLHPHPHAPPPVVLHSYCNMINRFSEHSRLSRVKVGLSVKEKKIFCPATAIVASVPIQRPRQQVTEVISRG